MVKMLIIESIGRQGSQKSRIQYGGTKMEVKTINCEDVIRSSLWPNYGATRNGDVYRWDTNKKMKIYLSGGRNECTGDDPYLAFRACHENRPSTVFVHKIVAECWIDNDDPLNKVDVNHKDGNKRNPNKENLEWVTRSQNQQHALSTGLKQRGEELYNSALTDDQVHLVCQYLIDGLRVKDIADFFGCSKDIIGKIKAGDTYFHIRVLYDIPHKYRVELSESTVRWVCDKIISGFSDVVISELSSNMNVTPIEVKRIRRKTRYSSISKEYF